MASKLERRHRDTRNPCRINSEGRCGRECGNRSHETAQSVARRDDDGVSIPHGDGSAVPMPYFADP